MVKLIGFFVIIELQNPFKTIFKKPKRKKNP